MKYKWLNKINNKKLIVFFNGWGMDENIITHLEPEDYDILMFYDYITLDIEFDWNILDTYNEKILVAWSMGVMVGSEILNNYSSHFSKKVAINGTLKPIDSEFGIHPKIYDLTIKGFNEKGRERFISSMFDVATQITCERDIDNQHFELISLKNYSSNLKFNYNKILISDNDKIIPTKSQVAYWGIEPNLKGGHCPFFIFKKWSEIL